MSSPRKMVSPAEHHRGPSSALHPDSPWVRAVRLLVGAFVLAALVQKTYDATLPGNDVDSFQLYSEFTVQANLGLALLLIASAAWPAARLSRWWDHLFGAFVLYLVMTGLIYIVLVAPPEEPWWSWDLYWPQMAHHRLAPLYVLLDWLLVTRTVRGPWWRPLAWLAYPVAFLIFSWVRGSIDGWYVYDFLDPTLEGGWPAALASIAQVLVAFLVIAALVHLAGNARAAPALGRRQREGPAT
ncbi:Pr6Pr family membrane protein [Pseudarthrobacter scleromae]|uniref:Pr6Pr family membrane protein n=1 Tax=Pseudarthrobacter scleromae TaxID=158897 RepID=UPI003D08449E